MIEPMCERLQGQKEKGRAVKIIRQDNAGDNKKLQKRCSSADWKLDTDFEYTAKETPQQNSLAETAFTTIAARSRAALNAANVPMKERYRLFAEAANTATKLDWLQGVTIGNVTKT